ncbi:MAG: hypothetical protein DI498_03310 [Paracoccus denitrificans]|nr:MAG: hypothetical protein DI498_03310 [Paracoccus denitrificans]PZO85556.1 MAG: hypothetical protein DI633_03310 [Paracoccus denitrificans]
MIRRPAFSRNFFRCLAVVASAVVAAVAFHTPAQAQAQSRSQIVLTEGDGQVVRLPADTTTVFVADPAIADAQALTADSIFVTGYAPGRTNIVAMSEDGNQVAQHQVNVLPASGGAEAMLPSSVVSRQDRGIAIMSGSTNDVSEARGVAQAERAYNSQDVAVQDNSVYMGGTQISLRVRFVEASRSELQRLGVNLAAVGSSTSGPIRVTTALSDPTGYLLGGTATSPSIGGRISAGRMTIDSLIDALEQRGAVQILSEPTLTTVSGRRASFQAGGEIGYPVNQGDGVISAAFKQYGVSIDFTPTLLPNKRIALEVKPEVSFLDESSTVSIDGFSVPGLSVRRADTTVELGSGQTFAIAGLYEQYSENSRRGVPGLSGVLGNSARNRRERELIIFITPYISDAANVVAPTPTRRATRNTVGFITR